MSRKVAGETGSIVLRIQGIVSPLNRLRRNQNIRYLLLR
jgi:hypothetical protein